MHKFMFAALLAGYALPSQAATVIYEGSFGPATEGVPSGPIDFRFVLESIGDPVPGIVWELAIADMDLGGATEADLSYGYAGLDYEGVAVLGIPTYLLRISGGLKDGRSFIFYTQINGTRDGLIGWPGDFLHIYKKTPGPVWRNPTLTQLSISPDFVLKVPAPEPATWAMMIGGFALAGAAMRHRKAAVSFA